MQKWVRVREELAENCVTLDSHDGERGSSRSLCGSVYTGLLSKDILDAKIENCCAVRADLYGMQHLWKGGLGSGGDSLHPKQRSLP